MKTLQEKYIGLQNGNYTKAEFIRDARKECSTIISPFNSADDAIKILKNKGILTEEKKKEENIYPTWKPDYMETPAFNASLYQVDLGIRVELAEKGIQGIPNEEQYNKAREKAIKNLAKNQYYYTTPDIEDDKREDILKPVEPNSTNQMEKVNEVLGKLIEKVING